jgi:hypothetical protein
LDELFFSSFSIGIASVIFEAYIYFLIWLLLCLIAYSYYKWRQWVIVFLGILLPILSLALYHFIFGNLTSFTENFSTKYIHLYNVQFSFSIADIVFYIVLALFLILSFFSLIQTNNDSLIAYRRKNIVVIILMVCSLIPFFFFFNQNNDILIIAIPISMLISKFLLAKRKIKYSNFFLIILFCAIIFKVIGSF